MADDFRRFPQKKLFLLIFFGQIRFLALGPVVRQDAFGGFNITHLCDGLLRLIKQLAGVQPHRANAVLHCLALSTWYLPETTDTANTLTTSQQRMGELSVFQSFPHVSASADGYRLSRMKKAKNWGPSDDNNNDSGQRRVDQRGMDGI